MLDKLINAVIDPAATRRFLEGLNPRSISEVPS